MVSLSDAIPLRDLERIARLEETAIELERKANRMLFDAQDMRYRVEAIRDKPVTSTIRNGSAVDVVRAAGDAQRAADWLMGVG
jgi:hypothetical protein